MGLRFSFFIKTPLCGGLYMTVSPFKGACGIVLNHNMPSEFEAAIDVLCDACIVQGRTLHFLEAVVHNSGRGPAWYVCGQLQCYFFFSMRRRFRRMFFFQGYLVQLLESTL